MAPPSPYFPPRLADTRREFIENYKISFDALKEYEILSVP